MVDLGATYAAAVERLDGLDVGGVVLVEGSSDQAALEALAVRRGRDLAAEGIAVVAIGGATSIGRFVDALGPGGRDLRLAGLSDAGEEDDLRRRLRRAGLDPGTTRADLEALGFYVCDADLEDELIRALGTGAVEQLVEAAGELPSFRTFQNQPFQRDRPLDAQLRRFIGTRSGRKIRYGRLLVDALDLDRVPRPLDGVLETCRRWAEGTDGRT